MTHRDSISKDMPVIDSSGRTIGAVDAVEGDTIKLTATDSSDGRHHYVLLTDVARVDQHVHLSTTGLPTPATAAPAGRATGLANGGGIERILPWVLIGLGLLVAILWLTGSFDSRDNRASGVTDSETFSREDNTTTSNK